MNRSGQASSGNLAWLALNLLLWGYNWVPLRYMVMDCPPLTCTVIRVVGGALTLFTVLSLKGRPLGPPLDRSFIWSGLTQVAGNSALCSLALIHGGVSKSAILVFTMPFWVLTIASLVFHERIALMHWISLVIALCGIALITSQSFANWEQILGALCAIGAGLAWAIGATIVRHSPAQDTLRRVAWEQLVGVLPLLALAFVMGENLPVITPRFVLAALYSSLIGTGVGWILWNRSATVLSPATLSLGSLAIPIIASTAAFVQLGEKPDTLTLTGLATVLFALLVANLAGMIPAPSFAALRRGRTKH